MPQSWVKEVDMSICGINFNFKFCWDEKKWYSSDLTNDKKDQLKGLMLNRDVTDQLFYQVLASQLEF